MNNRPSKNELLSYIFYGLAENNLSPMDISSKTLDKIIFEYGYFANDFQQYVLGKLDTFKRASCLLLAINKVKVTEDKSLNAEIALTAAFKMCEKPCLYLNDTKKELATVNLKEWAITDRDTYNYLKQNLIVSLIHSKNQNCLAYHLNLELIYEKALQFQKKF